MGLFFVNKYKYLLLKEKYERAIEQKEYFKGEAKRAIEDKNEAIRVRNLVISERDYYKEQNELNYQKYRKTLSSNGGYQTRAKELEKQVKKYKNILGMTPVDPTRNLVVSVDLSTGNDLHYEPSNKNIDKNVPNNFKADELSEEEHICKSNHRNKKTKEELIQEAIQENKYKCKCCGTKSYIGPNKNMTLCRVCGKYVFKNERDEFLFRFMEARRKIK